MGKWQQNQFWKVKEEHEQQEHRERRWRMEGEWFTRKEGYFVKEEREKSGKKGRDCSKSSKYEGGVRTAHGLAEPATWLWKGKRYSREWRDVLTG